MCGRFTLTTTAQEVAEFFGVQAYPSYQPRYNVAPSQLIAVIGLKKDGKTRGMLPVRWGFVPSWANDPRSGPKPINARAETVAFKPPFDESFRAKRCLIPADGFFEWASVNRKKVPHHFRLRRGGLFAFAGLWDVWHAEGEPMLATCAIITVAANEVVRPFHDRMPAVLSPEQYDAWLDLGTPEAELLAMLSPLPAGMLEVVEVNPAVNKVANDSPECVAPAA